MADQPRPPVIMKPTLSAVRPTTNTSTPQLFPATAGIQGGINIGVPTLPNVRTFQPSTPAQIDDSRYSPSTQGDLSRQTIEPFIPTTMQTSIPNPYAARTPSVASTTPTIISSTPTTSTIKTGATVTPTTTKMTPSRGSNRGKIRTTPSRRSNNSNTKKGNKGNKGRGGRRSRGSMRGRNRGRISRGRGPRRGATTANVITASQSNERKPVPQANISAESLTIYSHLDAIFDIISQNVATVVKAPTGTGKSVGLPWRISQAGPTTKIFVSVPTVVAAQSLARYQRRLSPNVSVGYAAEGSVNYDDNTQIVYATSGHVRRKILRSIADGQCVDMDWASVLIIDEAHSGSIDNTMIYGLWLNCLKAGKLVPRMVLASATISEDSYTEWPMYAIDNKHHNITIDYHERSFLHEQDLLFRETATVVVNYHKKNIPGHFLVFAPGSGEVDRLVTLLESRPDLDDGVTIIPAYASLSAEQLNYIYSDMPGRKIIVATNVAETAITISDVGLVVDMMLEKVAATSSSGGFRLETTYISKSSADQRCGRTGRTQEGICHRMITRSDYMALEKERLPEIARVPIYRTVIELLAVGLDASLIIPEITESRMTKAIRLLKKLGMIDARDQVTDKGTFVSDFPLSVRNASILYDWVNDGLPAFPIISTLTMIDSYGPSYFWYPRKEKDESISEYNTKLDVHRETYFADFVGYSDVETFLKVWLSMLTDLDQQGVNLFGVMVSGGGGRFGVKRSVKTWAKKHSINGRKIWEAYNIAQQTINGLRRYNSRYGTDYDLDVNTFDIDRLIEVLRPYVKKSYFDLIMTQIGSSIGNVKYRGPLPTDKPYTLDKKKSVNAMLADPPAKIAALVTAEISGKRGQFRLLSVGLDMSRPKPKISRPTAIPAGYSAGSTPALLPVGAVTTVTNDDNDQRLPVADDTDDDYVPGDGTVEPTTSTAPVCLVPVQPSSATTISLPVINPE